VKEIYQPVNNYNNYWVSNLGNILSLHRHYGLVLMSPVTTGIGYSSVMLSKNNKRKRYYVHRLVLASFKGSCPIGHNSNHKNCIKNDNRLSNLEYVTFSDNLKHSFINGRWFPPDNRGESNGHAKLDSKQVKFILRTYGSGQYNQYELAKMFDVSRGLIGHITRRKSWRHVNIGNI